MEEITPQDIKAKYEEEEERALKNLIALTIHKINDALLDNYKTLVESGRIHISSDYLGFSDKYAKSRATWEILFIKVAEHFKSWRVDYSCLSSTGKHYFDIYPKAPINCKKLGNKKAEKEEAHYEPVQNRSELLDLG